MQAVQKRNDYAMQVLKSACCYLVRFAMMLVMVNHSGNAEIWLDNLPNNQSLTSTTNMALLWPDTEGFGKYLAMDGKMLTLTVEGATAAFSDNLYLVDEANEGRWHVLSTEDDNLPLDGPISTDVSGTSICYASAEVVVVVEYDGDGGWSETFDQTASEFDDDEERVLTACAVGENGMKFSVGSSSDSSGDVWIFEKGADGEWSQQVALTWPSTSFGSSLSMSSNYLAVGDPDSNTVHLYSTDGDAITTLSRPEAIGGDTGFGIALSLSDELLVIGDPNANDQKGAAYIYNMTGFPSTDVPLICGIQNSDKEEQDQLGFSVAQGSYDPQSHYIFLGKPGESPGAGFTNERGSVRVFDVIGDQCSHNAEIKPKNDGSGTANCGYSVAYSNQFLYFGCPSAENYEYGTTHLLSIGRLYNEPFCHPNNGRTGVTVADQYLRECISCDTEEYSLGGFGSCQACTADMKPVASAWTEDAGPGCDYTCLDGFFGPSCRNCTSFHQNLGTYLTQYAHWVDGSSTCYWECDEYFTLKETDQTCTPPNPPPTPSDVQIMNTTWSQLLVQWEMEASTVPISYFTVVYQTEGSNASQVLAPGEATSLWIEGLLGNTTYTAQVQGHNFWAPGNWSQPSLPATTLAPVVPRRPNPPFAKSVTGGTITFGWNPPRDLGGRPITEYVLRVYDDEDVESNSTDLVSQILFEGQEAIGTVGRLSYTTKYFAALMACSSIGCSRESAVSNLEYTESSEVPSAVESIGFLSATQSSIQIQWEAPVDTGGLDIDTYELYVSATGGSQIGVSFEDFSEGQPLIHTDIFSVATNASLVEMALGTGIFVNHTVSGLAARTVYQVWVRALNSNGVGEWLESSASQNTSAPTTPTSPSVPTLASATPSSITLDWDPPEDLGGLPLTGYKVYFAGCSFNGTNCTLETPEIPFDIASSAEDLTASTGTVIKLFGDATYFFKVQAFNAQGFGPNSSVSLPFATLPPVPPIAPAHPTVINTTSSTVTLRISPPENNGGALVKAYVVYGSLHGAYAQFSQKFVSTAQGLMEETVVLTGMDAEVTYYFAVAAKNIAGLGEMGEFSRIGGTTDSAYPPSSPMSLSITGVTSSTLTIVWDSPADLGGAAIDSYLVYLVEQWPLSSSNATLMSVDSLAHANSTLTLYGVVSSARASTYTLTGLYGDTTFKVAVFGTNSAGTGTEYALAGPVATAPPHAPGQISSLQVISSPGTIFAIWEPPTDEGGLPLLNYTVQSTSVETGISLGLITTASTIRAAVLSNLSYSSDISVSGRGTNAAGDGNWSSISTSTPSSSEVASGFQLSVVNVTSSTFTVQWDLMPSWEDYILYLFDSEEEQRFLLEREEKGAQHRTLQNDVAFEELVNQGKLLSFSKAALNGQSNVTVQDLAALTSYRTALQISNGQGFSSPVLSEAFETDVASTPSAPLVVSVSAYSSRIDLVLGSPLVSGGFDITSFRVLLFTTEESATCTSATTTKSLIASETAVYLGAPNISLSLPGLYANTCYIGHISAANAGVDGYGANQTFAITTVKATPPSAPGRPVVDLLSVTSADASISWDAPEDLGGISEDEVVYTLYALDGSLGWDIIQLLSNYSIDELSKVGSVFAVDCETGSTKCEMKGLMADTCYHFRVVPTNSAGSGSQSALSGPACTDSPAQPSSPQVFEVPYLSTERVSLQWAPPDWLGGSRLAGYKLQIAQLGYILDACDTYADWYSITEGTSFSPNDSATDPYNGWSNLWGPFWFDEEDSLGAELSFQKEINFDPLEGPFIHALNLTSLEPARAYHLHLRAFTEANLTSNFTSVIVIMPAVAPPKPVFEVSSTSHSSITVNIQLPGFHSENGGCKVEQFIANITRLDVEQGVSKVIDEVHYSGNTFVSATFGGLYRFSPYEIEILFVNQLGISRNSSTEKNWTLPSTPSSTIKPNVSFINTVTAAISWTPPLDNGGIPILYYQVLQWNVSTGGIIPDSNSNLTLNGPTTYFANATEGTQRIISWLSPSSAYWFAVSSVNAIGESNHSDLTSVTTADPLPCLTDEEGVECGGGNRGHCHYWNGNCMCHEPYIGNVCETINGEELKLKLNGTVAEFDEDSFIYNLAIVLDIPEERLFIMSVVSGSIIVHLVIEEPYNDDPCMTDVTGCLDALTYKAYLFDAVYHGNSDVRALNVIAIGEVGVGHFNTTMPAACSTHSDCATCAQTRASCVWCDHNWECAEVQTTPSAACGGYSYYDAETMDLCPIEPQSERCPRLKDCTSCSLDVGCGWCPDTDYCGEENSDNNCLSTESWSLDTCYDTCSTNKVISQTYGQIDFGGSHLSYLPNVDCFWQIWPVTDGTATTYLEVIVYFSRIELGIGDIIAVYDKAGIQSVDPIVTITGNNSDAYVDINFVSETGYLGIYFVSDQRGSGHGFTAVYELKADSVNAFIVSAIIVAMIAGCLCCTCVCLKTMRFLISSSIANRNPPRATVMGQTFGVGRNEQQGLSKKDIDKIRKYTYGTNPPEDYPEQEGDECSICLVEFEAGHKCRLLPCTHKFHLECADTWFERSRACPLCKQDVIRPISPRPQTSNIDDNSELEMTRSNRSNRNANFEPHGNFDELERVAQGSDGTIETLHDGNQISVTS